MSIPGSQPNPNQPNPYQSAPYQPTQGAGIPSPYGQPPATPPGQPPVAPPQQFGPPAGPGGQPPLPPGAPGGGKGRGALWALGGVLLASAVWAGALFATGTLGGGSDDDKAEFAGNAFTKDLCAAAELTAFTEERYEIQESGENKAAISSRQPGLDQSQCNRNLKDQEASGSTTSYSSTYISASATWHKKTDPAGEFVDTNKAWEDFSTDTYAYKTETVDGLGDEAVLITETRDGTSGESVFGGMRLTVREGWFTFEMRWSWYGGTDDKPPSENEIEKMLTADTKEALAALKKS